MKERTILSTNELHRESFGMLQRRLKVNNNIYNNNNYEAKNYVTCMHLELGFEEGEDGSGDDAPHAPTINA